jgi:VanZ family protein
MNKLWLGFAAIAAYGSIYPFDFQLHQVDPMAWQAFLDTCCKATGRGDILGNVILFLPFGFLGILAARAEARPMRSFLFVCFVGFVFALLLQIAQFYLPSRDENLQDVIWNLLGIAVGAGLALPARRFVRNAVEHSGELQLVPWILIGSWLSYRLIPFVPSIDFQSIKDSVKPLLAFDSINPESTAFSIVAWLLAGHFLKLAYVGKRLDRLLPLLMLATFGLEILIVYNVLTPANVIGGLIAVILHRTVFSRLQSPEASLLASLLLVLVWVNLSPFVLRAEPQSFNWLPFQGFFGGSMFTNAQSACQKVFLYGSIVYLLLRMGAGSWISVLAASVWIGAIEVGQSYLIGHTPEITDPLLVVFAALAVIAIENMATTPHSRKNSRDHLRRQIAEHWITQRVNLNVNQSRLLEDLAREMGISVPEANRKIIEAAINEVGQTVQDPEEQRRKLGALMLSGRAEVMEPDHNSSKWVAQDIALHPSHYNLLHGISLDHGSSVSRLVRRILDRFFARLAAEED